MMTNALTLVVAVCTGFGAVVGAFAIIWRFLKPWLRAELLEPVQQTRHQVSVNAHSSTAPTVLDRLDDVRRQLDGVSARLDEHLEASSAESHDMWRALALLHTRNREESS